MDTSRVLQRRRTTALVMAAVVLLSTAFGGVVLSAAAQDGGNANVRIAHASPDAGQVDVFVDDTLVADDASIGYVSEYVSLSPGDHNVVLRAPDGEEVLFQRTVSVEADTNYTAVIAGEDTLGSETPLNLTVVADDPPETAANESAVRLIHASPDAGAVDVTVESFEAADGGSMNETTTTDAETETATDGETTTADGETTTAEGETTTDGETTATDTGTSTATESAEADTEENAMTEEDASNSSDALFENVTFGTVTDYQTVQAGNYTLAVRSASANESVSNESASNESASNEKAMSESVAAESADNSTAYESDANASATNESVSEEAAADGDVVKTVNVTLEGGTSYTVLAIGYANPEQAPENVPFDLVVVTDGTTTAEEPATDTATETTTAENETTTDGETTTTDGGVAEGGETTTDGEMTDEGEMTTTDGEMTTTEAGAATEGEETTTEPLTSTPTSGTATTDG
jgi:hypothetical protein